MAVYVLRLLLQGAARRKASDKRGVLAFAGGSATVVSREQVNKPFIANTIIKCVLCAVQRAARCVLNTACCVGR